jgi:hypothetical protein
MDLGYLRDKGTPPQEIIGLLAHLAGLTETPAPITPQELIPLFSWDKVEDAAGYNVYVAYENDAQYTLVGNVLGNGFYLRVPAGKENVRKTFCVTAVNADGRESERTLVYYNPDGSADPRQTRIVNNMIIMTDDGWKTSRSGLGEFTVDGLGTFYGLIAEAVLSGYIESSVISGGEIMIGEQPDGSYAFRVYPNGTVTMGGDSSIGGYTASDFDKMNNQIQESNNAVQEIQGIVENLNSKVMYRVEIICDGAMIMNVKNQAATLKCKVYSWDNDITDTLDSSAFNWIRSSNDRTQDETWNNNSAHKGRKTLTITTEDITNNANFYCEVSLPE